MDYDKLYRKHNPVVSKRTFVARLRNGWDLERAAQEGIMIPKLGVACAPDYSRRDLAVSVLQDMVKKGKARYDNFRVLIADQDPLADEASLDDTDIRVEFLDFTRIIGEPNKAGIKRMCEYMVEECSHIVVFWDGETSKRIKYLLELADQRGLKVREYVY